mmetsp:Transcript_3590/g.11231  ORF Transcript_3590/g.11231 Transcript_3590/m.11231 type:complete len:231 (-) Transcript_3590:443-1135(-)|eukprot:CAMPEP_0174853096 /NCGR_PEP_ID=MMETSP1114-20130205/27359_1 /TAXON_ID=312471 /ORGANISM="Neobodo designis, Strain CCAP 1951/1" /LENGTH=230 /DNA_ID=CAMNT_0016087717 /DNA_START=42 /DNA_END=734 /DNA_ORIENTATION=+
MGCTQTAEVPTAAVDAVFDVAEACNPRSNERASSIPRANSTGEAASRRTPSLHNHSPTTGNPLIPETRVVAPPSIGLAPSVATTTPPVRRASRITTDSTSSRPHGLLAPPVPSSNASVLEAIGRVSVFDGPGDSNAGTGHLPSPYRRRRKPTLSHTTVLVASAGAAVTSPRSPSIRATRSPSFASTHELPTGMLSGSGSGRSANDFVAIWMDSLAPAAGDDVGVDAGAHD